jgi:hypothetical protein
MGPYLVVYLPKVKKMKFFLPSDRFIIGPDITGPNIIGLSLYIKGPKFVFHNVDC